MTHWLEEHARPMPGVEPDPDYVFVKLRIPTDTADRVRNLALRAGMPRTWVYNRLIRMGLGLGVGPTIGKHIVEGTKGE